MTVRVEQHGPVTAILIARPEVRNAVDRDTADALTAAFRAFEEDNEARVAVLFGEGGHFCAGADLKAISSGRANRVEPDGDGPMGPTRMVLHKPLIAAIAGYAVAGGIELALLADLRVVERSAKLGVLCRRWGVPLIDGGTIRLPRVVGLGRALDLILTGRLVGADEALAMGLANRVVDDGTSLAAAIELAREIAAFPQACMRGDRMSAYEALDLSLAEGISNELRHGVASFSEMGAGVTRFASGEGRGGAGVK